MSRTRRNEKSVLNSYRIAKGHKRARLNSTRKRAIPPDSWDERAINPEIQMPLKAMYRMKAKGLSQEEAITKVRSKWKVSNTMAEKIAERVYD